MRDDLMHVFDEKAKKSPKSPFPRSANSKKVPTNFEDKQEFDGGSVREGMGTAYKANNACNYYKEGGYHNFRPITRMLKSKVGQPWDQVFSEICEKGDNRRYDGRQLRYWVENMLVETRCHMIDGVVYTDRGMPVGGHYSELYVHPETRLLTLAPKNPRWKRKEKPPTVFEVDDMLYHQHNGIWWRVKFKKWLQESTPIWDRPKGTMPVCVGHTKSYNTRRLYDDVFLGKRHEYDAERTYSWGVLRQVEEKYGKDEDGDYRLCIWKQSANKKEIARIKKHLKEMEEV